MKDSDLPTSSTPASNFLVRVVQPEIVGYSSRKTTIGNFAAGLTSLPKCATIYGGDGAGDDLTIKGTSHMTPSGSNVILQPTAGNVGIGTTSPAEKLDVDGNFRATGNVTGSQIRARFDDGWGNGGIRFYDTSGNPSAFLGCFNNSNFAMRLGTNGNGMEIINGAGTVMIAKISDNGLVRCAALAWAISGTKTSAYTIGAADGTIVCDASGGDFTVTLPAASGNAGRIYIVKKIGAPGVVTVDGSSSETIDGAADYALNSPNQVVRIQCNAAGTGWYVI